MQRAIAVFLALLGAIAGLNTAIAQTAPADAMAWLKRIASAARQTNYAGTFVYQHGRQVETSYVAHWSDASGEAERLETLDGPQREIIRNNDNVTCYMPDSKTVVIEKRTARQFPLLLPEQLSGIAENYTVRRAEADRVAGHDCQNIALEPKDNLRYGHTFCADMASGLPLRARTYNESGGLVDHFAFTQITIGPGVTKDMLKSRLAAKSQTWQVDRSALEQRDATQAGKWVLRNELAGFKKLMEMKRTIAGRSAEVSHIVYSDGLAAVSVFVEPMPKSPPAAGATYQGAVNIYVKPFSDQMVTVVGETPARTIRQIAESVSPR